MFIDVVVVGVCRLLCVDCCQLFVRCLLLLICVAVVGCPMLCLVVCRCLSFVVVRRVLRCSSLFVVGYCLWFVGVG